MKLMFLAFTQNTFIMFIVEAMCRRRIRVPNGMFGLYSRNEGTQVSLVCNKNYKVIGASPIYTCSNGIWNGTAQCSTNYFFV